MSGKLSKRLSFNVTAGLNQTNFKNVRQENFDFTYFRPYLNLSYFVTENSDLTFIYSVNTQTPSVSDLTYNPYFKDAHYIYVGNPDLKPGRSHDASLSFFKGYQKFVMNVKGEYEYTKDAITPVFTSDWENISETFANIDNSQKILGRIYMQWYPFPSNLLRLIGNLEVSHTLDHYGFNDLEYTSFMFIGMANLYYRKWGLEAFWQTSRKTLTGQLLNSRSSMVRCKLNYRPVKELTIGIAVRYPFYDAWKSTKEVVGTSLLNYHQTERVPQMANMIYLTLVYNFSFGSKGISAQRRLSNQDTDTGILNRK